MRVAALAVHPVKGCAGIALDHAVVTPTGLEHDRRFMVVGPDGTFRSQRRDPLLATIVPELPDGLLVLRAPGVGDLTVAPRADGPRSPVSIFGREHPALDQGDDAADWLAAVLGAPSRLVATAPEHHRPTDGAVPGWSGWADSGAVTVLGTASLDALSDRIVSGGGPPLGADRFRSNVLLRGASAQAEDHLDCIRVGTTELAFAKLAVRCAVTTVDQDTGERDGPEPLRTLAGYRRDDEGGVVFGVKFSVVAPGEVAVGDAVRAL